MVDFAVDRRAAEFARPREEALDQLVAPDVDMGRVAIYEHGLFLSSQWDAPESGHEGPFAVPFHHLCWPFSSSVRRIDKYRRTDELNGQHSRDPL